MKISKIFDVGFATMELEEVGLVVNFEKWNYWIHIWVIFFSFFNEIKVFKKVLKLKKKSSNLLVNSTSYEIFKIFGPFESLVSSTTV